jgi:hypothetical protein
MVRHRNFDKHVTAPEQIMTLREYRQYAEKIYGANTINDFMLRVMDVASGGLSKTRLEWDKMQVGIKLKHAEMTGGK